MVITILGIVSGIVAFNVQGSVTTANHKAARIDLGQLTSALDQFFVRFSTYPTAHDGLGALVDPPSGYGILRALPVDPWGQRYVYRARPAGSRFPYEVFSSGPDGRPDTKDDIFPKDQPPATE